MQAETWQSMVLDPCAVYISSSFRVSVPEVHTLKTLQPRVAE